MSVTFKMTPKLMEGYLVYLKEKGRKSETITHYRRTLELFYKFLPEGKRVDTEEIVKWRRHLTERGCALRTVSAYISILNSFLQYAGRPEMKQSHIVYEEEMAQPELTRGEYLRLLVAARNLGKERIYLIVKTLGSLGLSSQELHLVTVEAVQRGIISVPTRDGEREVHIPEILRSELLDYMTREEILSGCLFVTASGAPMERTHIWSDIQRLCAAAQVPEEKANVRCLCKMYKNTHREIQERIAVLAEQAYEHLLEQEQVTIGWNN